MRAALALENVTPPGTRRAVCISSRAPPAPYPPASHGFCPASRCRPPGTTYSSHQPRPWSLSLLDPQQMKPPLAPIWACGPGTVSKAARKQTLQEQSGGPRADGWAPYHPQGAGNLREGDAQVTTKPFKMVRPLQQRAAANTARCTLALSLPCWDKI